MPAAGASIALAALLTGCAASQSQPWLAVAPPLATGESPWRPAASRPADDPAALDVQQLSGQIVAGVQAELTSRIQTAVETTLRAEVQATGVGLAELANDLFGTVTFAFHRESPPPAAATPRPGQGLS